MNDKTKVLEREDTVSQQTLWREPTQAQVPAVARGKSLLETLVPDAGQQTHAVGQRVTRPDCRTHVLGETRYIDDITLPGMLYARIKRAGVASARIKRVDVSAAKAMPGVMAVMTGRDIPVNSFGPSFQDQPVLADEIVRHAGDGVAAVAAVTEQIANEAIEKIVVEYEPLPAVFDPRAAMDDDSQKVHAPNSNIYATKVIRKGDVAAGFAKSDHIFENTYSTQMVEHVPLEPHAAIADWDANGRLTVWATIGRITLARADLARTLKLPMNKVRLIGTIVGGNFGGKNEISHSPSLPKCLAARSRACSRARKNLSPPPRAIRS
jgi:CO/xanthine dehydrogenase Mo-binding subunit